MTPGIRYTLIAYGSWIVPICIGQADAFLLGADRGVSIGLMLVILPLLALLSIANGILIVVACKGIRTPISAFIITPGVIIGALATLQVAGTNLFFLLLFSGCIDFSFG